MEAVRQPVFFIEYEHRDITAHISPFVLSVTYADHEHGKSDEIDLQIEDRDALWKSSWYPGKSDLITLRIGYAGEPLLPCGSFQIDEIEALSPPDTINIKGLATGIKPALRQENTVAYEAKTLREIAAEIAAKHGLTITGDAIKDIKVKRITQKQERDVTFLKRLAESYGYIFKVTDSKLVFHERTIIEASPPIFTIARRDILTSWSLKDKTESVYSACEVAYHDPEKKQLITHTETASDVPKGDTLKLKERCESKEQAIVKATAALAEKNGLRTEGNLTLYGNQKLVAGSNITVTCLHKFSGTYHIVTSTHTMTRGAGYVTSLEVKRV